jgi:hypothetical protein
MLTAASFESSRSLLARASLVSPVRSRHLEAAFRSPITSAPGRPLRGLRSRPASSTPRWILLRSVRPAAPRFAGLPRHWRSQHRLPVALIRVPRSRSRLGSAPLWGCLPRGINSIRFAAGKLAFRNGPISCRSPHSVRLLRFLAPGLLLFRRLAVPQISWNHFNFPPVHI